MLWNFHLDLNRLLDDNFLNNLFRSPGIQFLDFIVSIFDALLQKVQLHFKLIFIPLQSCDDSLVIITGPGHISQVLQLDLHLHIFLLSSI